MSRGRIADHSHRARQTGRKQQQPFATIIHQSTLSHDIKPKTGQCINCATIQPYYSRKD